ncbi:hypothetical protein A8V24_04470 [Yersinia pestis]|nr:hypothetical protein A8V24_04470 [Yersinia pestis]
MSSILKDYYLDKTLLIHIKKDGYTFKYSQESDIIPIIAPAFKCYNIVRFNLLVVSPCYNKQKF